MQDEIGNKPATLLAIAREIAAANPTFQAVHGPGKGNQATNAFMQELRNVRLLCSVESVVIGQ